MMINNQKVEGWGTITVVSGYPLKGLTILEYKRDKDMDVIVKINKLGLSWTKLSHRWVLARSK